MDEKLKDAHKNFRTVLACATLVATVNGGGQSKLVSEHQAEENNLRSLLSYVPAVLVRNNEVIAAVAHRPPPPTSASGAAIGTVHVNIIQGGPPAGPSEQGEPASKMGGCSGDMALLSTVTAIANPDVPVRKGDPYFPTDAPGPNCLIVKSGQSHLQFIEDIAEWERYIFELKDDDPLENHVATFSDFVKLARVYKHDSERYDFLVDGFSQYVVARCRKKMSRRISHWAAQGFIYHLGKVEESKLRAVAPQTASSLRNDSNLSDRLLEMEDDARIQEVVMKTCPADSVRSPLTSLLSACRQMQTLPRQEGRAGLPGISALYNKTTCFEFHQLLVATLLSYGKALDKFKDALANHKKQPDLQSVVRKADEVWTCSSLLWSIAYSRILENHLEILRQNGWLAAPVNRDFSFYSDFTHFEGNKKQEIFTADEGGNKWEAVNALSASGLARGDEGGSSTSDNSAGLAGEDVEKQDIITAEEDEEGGNKWGAVNALSASALVEGDEEGSSTSDNPAGLPGEDVEGGHEGEEINALYAGEMPVGLADVYHRWIRLQVDRWHAIRKITSSLTRSPAPIDLTLFAIRHNPPRLATSVMNPWSSTISDVCEKAGIDPGPVIDHLLDRIQREVKHSECNPIFKNFDPERTEVIMYTGRVHCEAALASLLKYPDGGDDDLRKHFEDSDKSAIAVSKLCCLVCWHLLRALRGASDDFHVRGHHKSLSQVELPQWLPLEVVVTVTTEFEKILVGEITAMQHHSKHGPRHSGDSRGGVSPDSSDGEEDIVRFQKIKRRRPFGFRMSAKDYPR